MPVQSRLGRCPEPMSVASCSQLSAVGLYAAMIGVSLVPVVRVATTSLPVQTACGYGVALLPGGVATVRHVSDVGL